MAYRCVVSPVDESLAAIAVAREVLIETSSSGKTVSTVIWVARSGEDLFVRSVNGDGGRWYQRVLANPEVALVADDVRVEFLAMPAADPESVARASAGLAAKYSGRSLERMLDPGVLHTTMRLAPRR